MDLEALQRDFEAFLANQQTYAQELFFRDATERHALFRRWWVRHGGHPGAQSVFAVARQQSPSALNRALQRYDYLDHMDDPVLYYSAHYGLRMYRGGLRERLQEVAPRMLERWSLLVLCAHEARWLTRGLAELRAGTSPELRAGAFPELHVGASTIHRPPAKATHVMVYLSGRRVLCTATRQTFPKTAHFVEELYWSLFRRDAQTELTPWLHPRLRHITSQYL